MSLSQVISTFSIPSFLHSIKARRIISVPYADFAAKCEGRYFATPKKMGAQTAEANVNAGIAAANQIVGFLRDGVTKFKVN